MTPARHHAEWMSLIETSGPFLSMPVLMRAFPQGLDRLNSDSTSRLREAYADWLERGAKQPAVHHSWIRHILTELLEYAPEFLAEGQAIPPGIEAVMANFGETLRPDFILKHRDSAKLPLLLIEHYAPDQDLEKPVAGKIWKASPGTRMMELLHATGVPLGLVTNGEQWMLVYAPRGETTGFASWYADLWMQEPITLRAFQSLLHLRRFLGVADPETLAALYAESAKDQQEVTEQLGYQVRRAVEMLVQAFDHIDAESGRTLFAGVNEKALYDGALTVMMRLVFLFCAEERKLLLLGDPLYDQYYAVSTLSEILRERADQHGEEVLERRHDAWCRLLATFRAVHAGVEHESMRLPPYGGTLFDPDRYPFLEGRAADTHWRTTPAKPLPINNRVVLHLLEALQYLRLKVPGGGPAEARRLSFRALDIEQIGHVYEGLLDHTAKRAVEPILGLQGTRDKEPEIALSQLEQLAGIVLPDSEEQEQTQEPFLLAAESPGNIVSLPRKQSSSSYAPPPKLVEFLQEETGRSVKALAKALCDRSQIDESRLLIACGQDRRLLDRVWRFAGLLRQDDFGQPVVIQQGSVYVTRGSDRRSTGTHYTPRSLTEPIVQHTLEPLVYIGPAEGLPKEQWKLKSPREILALKVCDMTMGSGAFLVQACRYLAERLVEAWDMERRKYEGGSTKSGESVTAVHPSSCDLQPLRLLAAEPSQGEPSERLLPNDPAEQIAMARRAVADRCLYGVDINPMAVEMAKLSLWLITLQRDRPFTFLDHALKCGDSLLGVSSVQQIENFSLRPGDRQVTFATANLFRYVEEASKKRRELEDLPSNDHTQIETKNRLHAEAEAATAKVKAIADCLIGFELRGLDGDGYENQRTAAAEKVQLLMKRDADARIETTHANSPSVLAAHAKEQMRGRRTFHWPVEFPEVFARGGFDAFVGNPPFMGGQKITGELGTDYRNYLVERIAGGQRGSADFCTYFFLRAYQSLNPEHGMTGLVATNTIAQGDTREVGLDQIAAAGAVFPRAVRSRPWPGEAALEVAHVWLRRGKWSGEWNLDGQTVKGVTAFLTEPGSASGKPLCLAANARKSFQGSIVLGMGFVLTCGQAQALIAKSERNRKVLFPFLNGEDLNSRPDQSPSRWVINFRDWPLDRLAEGNWANASEKQRVAWLKSRHVPGDYPGPVAADFPDCLEIVTRLAKPERDALASGDASARDRAKRWWQFGRPTTDLYEAIEAIEQVICACRVTKFLCHVSVAANSVFDVSTNVILDTKIHPATVLHSSLYDAWARAYGSSLESRLRYTLTDCFETFPFPAEQDGTYELGFRYHDFRRQIMLTRQEGLTKIYNRFHDRGEQSEDIVRLRALHLEMDQAVAGAYGWSDLDLGHGFHATKQGERFTISEFARRIVLDRLLVLNHKRYEEEVKAGLHEKGAKKAANKNKKSAAATQADLIKPPQQELFG